jgi:hypothetical protein
VVSIGFRHLGEVEGDVGGGRGGGGGRWTRECKLFSLLTKRVNSSERCNFLSVFDTTRSRMCLFARGAKDWRFFDDFKQKLRTVEYLVPTSECASTWSIRAAAETY